MLTPLATGISIGIGAATAAGLGAGGFAYASLWPASRLFGTALIAPPRAGELALTLDDGPNPAWTPKLLEILTRREVRATFFMVGSRAEAQPALVRQIAAGGHLIGCHSWSHRRLSLASARAIEEEISRGKEALEQITGLPIRFFRPPYGARRPATLRIARGLGLVPVLWNAMTSDWKNPSPDSIASRLRSKIDSLERRGLAANIVLHDGNHLDPEANRAPSVTAAAQLIARYQPTHQFVTLDAWLDAWSDA